MAQEGINTLKLVQFHNILSLPKIVEPIQGDAVPVKHANISVVGLISKRFWYFTLQCGFGTILSLFLLIL